MHLQYSSNLGDSSICYIVPFTWWKNYNSNKIDFIGESSNFVVEDIDTTHLIDTMIVQFEEEYTRQLSEKSNGIQFRNRFISPPLLQNKRFQEDYHIITSQQWASLQILKQKKIPVIIFALKQYQPQPDEIVEHIHGLYYVAGQKQFQIIMCTDKDSDLFIGHFPKNIYLIEAIRCILKEMKFVEVQESKIIFIDYQKDVATSFAKHQFVKVKELGYQHTFIMITNLIRISQNEEQDCRSDKAMNGEDKENNKKMIEQLPPTFDVTANHKTISTGASTPLTFSYDSERNDFQIMQMFREKTQQQIQEMKRYGNKIIEGELITIQTERDENELKNDLAIISEQMIESISHKKKNKEK